MLSESTGGHLELIKWETHAVPGFGSDPQAVINEQIGGTYDIFIGMLATKFGSPTPRAGSGTQEEFDRAYERFNKNPGELRIMFYFKDPEVKASELNLDEYKRVRDFQAKLGETGLYATFNTTEDFVTLVRLHLSRQLLEWAQKKWGSQITTQTVHEPDPSSREPVPLLQSTEEEELGLLDLAEVITEGLANGVASLARIEEAINDIGRKTGESTPKYIAAIEQKDLAKQKQIINYVAQALEEFALRVDTELPIFSNSFTSTVDAISRSATLWEADFKSDDKTDIRSSRDELQALLSAIATTGDNIVEFQETISGLPRLTTSFNKAKRQAVQTLSGLNRALSSSHNLTTQAVIELNRILDETPEENE